MKCGVIDYNCKDRIKDCFNLYGNDEMKPTKVTLDITLDEEIIELNPSIIKIRTPEKYWNLTGTVIIIG